MIASCNHYVYYCNEVELPRDCEGLSGIMEKCLADEDNRKVQKILERAANNIWKLTHIKEKHNNICDVLSR